MRFFALAFVALCAIISQTAGARAPRHAGHMHHSKSSEEAHHGHAHEHSHEAPIFTVAGQTGDKVFYTAHVHTNWLQALEFCHQNEMTLASLETPEELQAVAAALSGITHGSGAHAHAHDFYWTTGNDFGMDGHFKWLTTNSAVSNVQTSFSANNYESNCAQLHVANGGYLTDASCEQRKDDLPLCEDKSGVDRAGQVAVIPGQSEHAYVPSAEDSNESHGHVVHSHSIESSSSSSSEE